MTNDIDVLIIGSGIAGLTAAIEARSRGAKVLVLEKMAKAGGNSLLSDGGIAAAGTEEQLRAGIEDSPQLMYRDMMKAGEGINSRELVKILTEKSAQAFKWTKDYLNVPYLDRLDIFGGHSVRRCFTAGEISGKTFIKALLAKASDLGVQILYGHKVTKLGISDKGRPYATLVKNYKYNNERGGEPFDIHPLRALILATGGYGGDVPFRSAQDSRLGESIMSTGQPFVDSEVMKMAFSLGAGPVQLSRIQLGPWASPDESGYGSAPLFSEYILFQYGILIDPGNGWRFVNELSDRKTISDLLLQKGQPSIGLADHGAVSRSGWDISKAIEKGVVKEFESIDALCSYYEINSDDVTRTVARYNLFIEEGKDLDFGKIILDDAEPLITPPYYGVRLYPKVHYTMGGIRIDGKSRVLDLDGKPLEGLLAAGEVAGGIHGASRLGSCSITECIVFGRIAGETAAAL